MYKERFYLGTIRQGEHVVSVFEDEGDKGMNAYPLEHRVYHSPDGFCWGYSGSGPSELARCLLWDVMFQEPQPALYMKFRDEILAELDMEDHWIMDEKDVVAWLKENGGKDAR